MGIRKPVFVFALFLGACSSPEPAALPAPALQEGEREMLQENYMRAAQVFERIASSASAHSQRAAYLGGVCRIKLGQPAQAVPALQQLACSEISVAMRVNVLDSLSEAHRLLGQYSESLHALQAVERLPRMHIETAMKTDDLLFKLGCAYARMGDRQKSSDCFKELVQSYPTSLRSVDAALRLSVKGFGVRVGEAYPEKSVPPAPAGYSCSFVKVSVKGHAPATLAVVSGLPSYDDALKAAQRISREGVRAEPLP